FALFLAGACSKSSPPAEKCFVGDSSKPVELAIVHQTAQGEVVQTTADGRVPLIQPVQGGKVLFVSARARNLDGCPAHIVAALIDPETKLVVASEGRDIFLKPTSDGWLEPDLPEEPDNYSNLPACPTANLSRDIDEQPYTLQLKIQDLKGRTQETSLQIVP